MDQECARRVSIRCEYTRALVVESLQELVGTRVGHGTDLYDLLLDYPLRPAKGLRPTLCLAAAEALGASGQAALPSATALELLHNAFLIHDDVEDESLSRRGQATLQRAHGVATAVNVADGMFAMCLYPLLDNTETLGVGVSLQILQEFADTVRITVEGQAMELAWIRDNRCMFEDPEAAYVELVHRKTAVYSFVSPVVIGARVARANKETLAALVTYARHLGVAFQIMDDVLNLCAEEAVYGKETWGDLWEGKRTLILLHAISRETDMEAVANVKAVLALPRVDKTTDDVQVLHQLIERHRSLDHARATARRHCTLAAASLQQVWSALEPGPARTFLSDLVDFVVGRLR